MKYGYDAAYLTRCYDAMARWVGLSDTPAKKPAENEAPKAEAKTETPASQKSGYTTAAAAPMEKYAMPSKPARFYRP